MAIEIGALRALLSLDSAAFEKGAKRAQASMGRLERSLTNAAKKMGGVGKSMSRRVTAPFVAATGLMLRSSLKTVDAQAKFAQSLGTTTSSIQALTRAADMAGISQGDLEGSLRRMTRRISLAEQGAGAGAKAFERLGIEAADLADLDAAERIKLIQQRITELIPAAEQAAVASQVFGDKTGLAMLRLDAATIDKATEEISRFGVAVSDVDADKIEEANDAMSALGLVVTGLGNQLAVSLAPALKAIAERIQDVSAWFSDLSPQMRRFIASGAALAAAIGPLAIALGFVATGLAALASPIGLVVLAFGAVIGAAAAVAVNWGKLVEKYPALQSALDAVGAVAKRVWEAMKRLGEITADVAASLAESVGAIVDGIRGAYADVAASIDQLASDIADWIKEIPGRVVETAKQVGRDIIQGLVDGINEMLPKAKSAGRNAGRSAIDGAREETDTQSPSREFMRIGWDLMSGLSMGIADNAQAAAQAAASAAARVTDSTSDTLAEGSAQVSSYYAQIGDAVAGAITQGQNLGDAMRNVFNQIASDFISSGISDLLGNLFSGGGGGGGGSIFGALGSAFGGFFADGGVLGAGKWGIAGENGPEPIIGPAQVIPNSSMGMQRAEITVRAAEGVTIEDVRGEVDMKIKQAEPSLVRRSVAASGEAARSSKSYMGL